MDLCQHRSLLLRSLVNEYLSDSYRQTQTINVQKIPIIVQLVRSHQLLLPVDAPSAFSTSISAPHALDKEFYQIYQAHKQSIQKVFVTLEQLIASKEIESRCGGLILLAEFIKEAPYFIIQERANNWTNTIVDLIKKQLTQQDKWTKSKLEETKRQIQVLDAMIKRIHYFPSLRSSLLSNNHFTAIVNILVSICEVENNSMITPVQHQAIQTIAVIFQYVPSLVKSHCERISQQLSKFLYHPNEIIRNSTSQVIALIPQCAKPQRPAESFLAFFDTQIVTSAHLLLNNLFNKLDCQIDRDQQVHYQQQQQRANTASQSENSWVRLDNLWQKQTFSNPQQVSEHQHHVFLAIQSLFDVIRNAFTLTYQSTTEIPIVKFLGLFKRALLLDPLWLLKQKHNQHIDQRQLTQLLHVLPLLHSSALLALKQFIVQLQTHLMPFCDDLSQLITSTLRFYQLKTTPFHSTNRALLFTIGFHCISIFNVNVMDELGAPLIRAVLHQYSDLQVLLNPATQIDQLSLNKSKKKRKRNALNSDNHANQNIRLLEDQVPLADCFSSLYFHKAMKVVEICLVSAAWMIPDEIRRLLDQFVVSLLLSYSNEAVISVYSPLYDKQSLLALFKVLLASVLHQTTTIGSVLPFAIQLFNLAKNDRRSSIRLFALRALSDCDNILHPVRPPVVPLLRNMNVEPLEVSLSSTKVNANRSHRDSLSASVVVHNDEPVVTLSTHNTSTTTTKTVHESIHVPQPADEEMETETPTAVVVEREKTITTSTSTTDQTVTSSIPQDQFSRQNLAGFIKDTIKPSSEPMQIKESLMLDDDDDLPDIVADGPDSDTSSDEDI